MATRKHIASDEIRHDTSGIYFDTYTGTAEALIAAGLLRADQFPGGPGVNKVTRSFLPDGSEIRKGQNFRLEPGVLRITKRGRRFTLEVNVSEEEWQHRKAEYDAQREVERERREQSLKREETLRQAREAGMTPQEWVMRHVPTCEQDYIDELCSELNLCERMFKRQYGYGYGYSLDAPSQARLAMLFEAMRSFLKRATVTLEPAVREQEVDRLFQESGLARHTTVRPALRLVR